MTFSFDRSTALRSRRGASFAFLTCASLMLFSTTAPAAPPAEASTKAPNASACAESYRSAQVQRVNGGLRGARESLLVCVSDRCPAVLRPDCMRWLTEVEAAMPSVAFAAKSESGQDITDVRVSIDGQQLTEVLDGKSVPVDPGSHTLRFEHAGVAAIEQPIVVREGEKARVVTVSWAKAAAHDASPAQHASDRASGPPTSAWIFGGLGVAAVGTFAVLALHGMQRRSDLRTECFGSCDQRQVDPIKTELAIADVALGIGVVSLGVATVLLLTGNSSEKAPAPATAKAPAPRILQVGLAPQKNGGSVGLSGRF